MALSLCGPDALQLWLQDAAPAAPRCTPLHMAAVLPDGGRLATAILAHCPELQPLWLGLPATGSTSGSPTSPSAHFPEILPAGSPHAPAQHAAPGAATSFAGAPLSPGIDAVEGAARTRALLCPRPGSPAALAAAAGNWVRLGCRPRGARTQLQPATGGGEPGAAAPQQPVAPRSPWPAAAQGGGGAWGARLHAWQALLGVRCALKLCLAVMAKAGDGHVPRAATVASLWLDVAFFAAFPAVAARQVRGRESLPLSELHSAANGAVARAA